MSCAVEAASDQPLLNALDVVWAGVGRPNLVSPFMLGHRLHFFIEVKENEATTIAHVDVEELHSISISQTLRFVFLFGRGKRDVDYAIHFVFLVVHEAPAAVLPHLPLSGLVEPSWEVPAPLVAHALHEPQGDAYNQEYSPHLLILAGRQSCGNGDA